MNPLSEFSTEQAAQISNLTEDEKIRRRAIRFGKQSSQSQKPQKSKTEVHQSQVFEQLQLGTRVKDFIDTTRLYARVQDAISEASNEVMLNDTGRCRAWDYFHDGFGVDRKNKSRRESDPGAETEANFESQVEFESHVVNQENLQGFSENTEKVVLKLENNSTVENDHIILSPRYIDTMSVKEVQSVVDEPSFVPVISVLESSETFPEISSDSYEDFEEEETTAAGIDDNTIEDTDTGEIEDLDPGFRFATVCDLRNEVLGPPPPAPSQLRREELRRETAFKRKAVFKKFVVRKTIDRGSMERLRRQKDRMAIFDANRAHSLSTVLSELDSMLDLDTPVERLFRLEHPEYFPNESLESREERLREYEQARSVYEANMSKKMVEKQKSSLKRLHKLENKKLQEATSDSETLKWQEENPLSPSSPSSSSSSSYEDDDSNDEGDSGDDDEDDNEDDEDDDDDDEDDDEDDNEDENEDEDEETVVLKESLKAQQPSLQYSKEVLLYNKLHEDENNNENDEEFVSLKGSVPSKVLQPSLQHNKEVLLYNKLHEDDNNNENDEESVALKKQSVPSRAQQLSLRRNKKALSYGELRRRVKEKERNEKIQRELAKSQETARRFQIEDLRHKVLEEERDRKRRKLVDLSNERDKRDARTVQQIREIAATKITIGRAIRELEEKISAVESQLQGKSRTRKNFIQYHQNNYNEKIS